MAKKEKYYNIEKLLATKGQYLLAVGSRSNGKSYQAKLHVLKDALEGKGEFVYLRRYAMDVTPSKVVRYFSNMNIEEITKGQYNEVFARSGYIFLRYYNHETGKVDENIPPLLVGHYCALVQAEHIKSDASFENVKTIIFEEFITKNQYYKGKEEPEELMQLVSTVCRRRDIQVILIGNTLSRICPYVQHFGLKNLSKQAQGSIEVYEIETPIDEEGNTEIVKIAVEFCESTGYKSKMFIGAKQKSIVNGCWETDDEARLLHKYREYKMLYRMFLEDMGYSFAIELLQYTKENNCLCIFIYPCKPTKKDARILSTDYAESWNITPFLNLNNEAEKMIGKCYEFGKVAYSDNLTGADFKSILLNNDKLFKGASW